MHEVTMDTSSKTKIPDDALVCPVSNRSDHENIPVYLRNTSGSVFDLDVGRSPGVA